MRLRLVVHALCAGGLVLACACSDGNGGGKNGDSNKPGGEDGDGNAGVAGSAGTSSTAGQGGSGGASGESGQSGADAGGMAGSGGAGAGGQSGTGGAGGDAGPMQCAHEGDPLLDPSVLPSCESDACSNAHCLPFTVLTPEQAEQLADCDAQTKCVPDLLIETLGKFLLKTCTSLNGAEGRCLSTCVPRVQAQMDALPVDVCAEGERCTPCYDPITGEETGACSQSCDEGPTEDPVVFPGCCGDLGVCVPDALVPSDQQGMLGADSCTGDAVLCAPRSMAADPSFVPAACASLNGAEGRCLPACLPPIAEQADRLPSGGCAAGELCAPCFDPLTGASTGACEIGDDEPTEDPVTFAECCGGQSLCVPAALVPEAQQDLLDATGCNSGELCAPKDIATGNYVPQTCTSWGGAEGRCLLACLPDVAAQADRLTRGVCEAGELCVPCFDPLTGESTGACTIEGDEPAQDPPYVFPTCCDDGTGNDLGTCVPSALVPAEQQSLLGPDSCSEQGFVCAPTSLATDSYEPESCNSWLSAEGRCLPACLPDVDARAEQLKRASCGQGELCVPCFDPIGGESTGACEIDGDAPAKAPVEFPTCCVTNGVPRGTCVPAQAAGEQAASAPTLDCETKTGDADTYICAPNERIADPDYDFPSCTTTCGLTGLEAGLCLVAAAVGTFGNPGVCVPSCLLSEQSTPIGGNAANLFGRSTCATGEDCAPCINPSTDEPTGLCN